MTNRHDTSWTDERVQRLKELLAQGSSLSKIARDLGVTLGAVKSKMRRTGLKVDRTEAKAHQDAWRRERAKALADKKRAALASLGVVSKTSAAYRRQLPPAPVLTKSQMQEQLRQAVLNTGGRLA